MIEPILTEEELQKIKNDSAIRIAVAKKSHRWFFSIYFSHYIQYPFAPFHDQMFEMTEDTESNFNIILAFRSSGKSTICTTSFPVWAVTGKQQKKMVIIISQTQDQAKAHFTNIKRELEENELLKSDIGPFEEFSNQWGAYSIFIRQYGAWIIAASTEQKIRGIRNGPIRPDLIIIDDPEDLNSVKTKESRDRLFNWYNAEIVPLGNIDTKIVMLGNMLHEDSLVTRLKTRIDKNMLDGRVLFVPLIDSNNKITWPGRFQNMEAIEKLRKSVPSEIAYYREYLLIILPDEDQVVQRPWIQYYKQLPDINIQRPRFIAMGIDPALTENDTGAFTAALGAHIYGYGDQLRVYISPYFINKRVNFPDSLEQIKALSLQIGNGIQPMIYVEAVGTQGALAQMLVKRGCSAEEVRISGDKRFRLSLTAPFIKSGVILFPEKGNEDLITQIVGFGAEKYRDLCDAFSLLINNIMQLDQETSKSTIMLGPSFFTACGFDGRSYKPIPRDMKF